MASELRTLTFSIALTLTLGATLAQAADPIGTYRTAAESLTAYRSAQLALAAAH